MNMIHNYATVADINENQKITFFYNKYRTRTDICAKSLGKLYTMLRDGLMEKKL